MCLGPVGERTPAHVVANRDVRGVAAKHGTTVQRGFAVHRGTRVA